MNSAIFYSTMDIQNACLFVVLRTPLAEVNRLFAIVVIGVK